MAFWTGSAGAAAERMRIHPTGEVEMPYGIRSGNVTISNNGYTLLAAADVPKRGFILIQAGVNSDEWAIIAYRIDTTPYCVLGVGGGATNVATVALNGSTGSANFATVSATTSGIYIENRHGGSRDIRYLLIGD